MPKQHQDKVDVAAIVSSEQPFPIAWPKRVKDAIDAIVERGIAYNEAAAESGLTTRTMRLALERPHVLAYLKQQLKVLRDARGLAISIGFVQLPMLRTGAYAWTCCGRLFRRADERALRPRSRSRSCTRSARDPSNP